MLFSLTYVAANLENYTPNLIAGPEYSGLIPVNRNRTVADANLQIYTKGCKHFCIFQGAWGFNSIVNCLNL